MTMDEKIQLIHENRMYVKGWTAQDYFDPRNGRLSEKIKDVKIKYSSGKPVAWAAVVKVDYCGIFMGTQLWLYVNPIFRHRGIAKELIKFFSKKFILDRKHPVRGDAIQILKKRESV